MDQSKIIAMRFVTDPEKWGEIMAEHARKGAAMPGESCGKMCHDCAFKTDQPHTEEYYNAVDGACVAVGFDKLFHCHASDAEGNYIDSGRPCAGYLYAKRYLDEKFKNEE